MGFIFLLLVLMIILLGIASTIFWIWMLIDSITNPTLTESNKVMWVILIVLTHFIGAFCYLIIGRKSRQAYTQYQQAPNGINYTQNVYYPPAGQAAPMYQQPVSQSGQPHTYYPQSYPQGQYQNYNATPQPQAPQTPPAQPYQQGYQPPPAQPYQQGYQPAPAQRPPTAPWRHDDQPQASYPELPLQEPRQQ